MVLEVRNWGARLRRRYEHALRSSLAAQLRTGLPADTRMPNGIPSERWVEWAEERLNDAQRGGRGHNFTP